MKQLPDYDYRLVCQQERPDAIIEASDRKKLGLEIAHLFYDDLEAKILLGKTKTKIHGPERYKKRLKGGPI